MGSFRIVIDAVGGHGVDREKKEGEVVDFKKGGTNTPDAIAKEFVERMVAAGIWVKGAAITHWPEQPTEVKDDLLTGIRTGNF